jgi:hypothetical protein
LNSSKKGNANPGEVITQSTEYFAARRYVCTMLTDPSGQQAMTFFDFRNNITNAKWVIEQFVHEQPKALFMRTYEEVSKSYRANYDVVTLIKGSSPSITNN